MTTVAGQVGRHPLSSQERKDMGKVYLIWNDNKSECVGFTDRREAEEAAGIRKVVHSAPTLAEFFRENYADEDIFDAPERVFEIQEVNL